MKDTETHHTYTRPDIQQFKALAEATTPGEWTVHSERREKHTIRLADGSLTGGESPACVRSQSQDENKRRFTRFVAICSGAGCNRNADAAFIAAAHSAVPELIAYIERIEGLLQEAVEHDTLIRHPWMGCSLAPCDWWSDARTLLARVAEETVQ